jgi:hypothetical protein
MLIRAAILALATLGPISAASAQDVLVHQIQFRADPNGGCPDGYDTNLSNGRCYPNGYHAPGMYRRDYYGSYDRYGGGRYPVRCGHGADLDVRDGRCYPNGAVPPQFQEGRIRRGY